MYLNRWTPDFDPQSDAPYIVIVWVRLPHITLQCQGDDSLRDIGNNRGKFIDKAKNKQGMFQYARICVEVDLEKGYPKSIELVFK